MQPFTVLTGIAAPLNMANVDTDMIIPKQFLRTIKRTGLGINAFHDIRYNDDGSPQPGFILNRAPYDKAEIMITGENFGCGSSREHAPWALLDFGLRCIIAPSFADIFMNNCFKNGILAIELPEDQVSRIMSAAEDEPEAPLTIDLEKQTITRGNQFTFSFDIDPFRKDALLHGIDDIGRTLQNEQAISTFETKRRAERPWL